MSFVDLFSARPVARALCRLVAPELLGVAKVFYNLINENFSRLLRKAQVWNILSKYDHSEWRMRYLEGIGDLKAHTAEGHTKKALARDLLAMWDGQKEKVCVYLLPRGHLLPKKMTTGDRLDVDYKLRKSRYLPHTKDAFLTKHPHILHAPFTISVPCAFCWSVEQVTDVFCKGELYSDVLLGCGGEMKGIRDFLLGDAGCLRNVIEVGFEPDTPPGDSKLCGKYPDDYESKHRPNHDRYKSRYNTVGIFKLDEYDERKIRETHRTWFDLHTLTWRCFQQ